MRLPCEVPTDLKLLSNDEVQGRGAGNLELAGEDDAQDGEAQVQLKSMLGSFGTRLDREVGRRLGKAGDETTCGGGLRAHPGGCLVASRWGSSPAFRGKLILIYYMHARFLGRSLKLRSRLRFEPSLWT